MSRTVTAVNPATGQALETYDVAGLDDVLAVLGAVHVAQPQWAAVPAEQRAATTCAPSAPSSAGSGTSWPH